MKFDKQKLVEHLRAHLEKDRASLMAAAQATYEAATGDESRPENQYDTRALEASYLAGAQAKRVSDIDEQLSLLKTLELKKFTAKTPLSATALARLEHDDSEIYVFLLPKGGGLHVKFEGQDIQIVTPSSPLGEALLDLKQGDTAVVEVGADTKEYEILEVG